MRLLLTLVDGEEIEYKMEKDSVTIGRSSQCDLVISHESMSRQHCKIEFKNGEFFITDLGSINGVLIDGKKIPPNSSIPFHTYLHLAFGYVTSAQLVMDDQTKLGVVNTLTPKSDTGARTKPSVATRTASAPIKQKTATSEKSGKNTLLINLLAFLGVLGAIYYFLYAGNNSQDNQSTPSQSKTAPKPVDSSDHF